MEECSKRNVSYCIVCNKKASIQSHELCSKGCNFSLCTECLLKSCKITDKNITINNIYTKCFICRSNKIFIASKLRKILYRRSKFCCKITNESGTKSFIVYKNDSDNQIGLAQIMQEIKQNTIINFISDDQPSINRQPVVSGLEEFLNFITQINNHSSSTVDF